MDNDYLVFGLRNADDVIEHRLFPPVRLANDLWVGEPILGYVNRDRITTKGAQSRLLVGVPLYWRIENRSGMVTPWSRVKDLHETVHRREKITFGPRKLVVGVDGYNPYPSLDGPGVRLSEQMALHKLTVDA